MPIYEYACKQCNETFDHLARTMSSTREAAKVKCPKCGSDQTSRALSVFAVGSEGAKSSSTDTPSCGRCGGAPGSCMSG